MTFSAEARVIAAFTFITALLLGAWATVGSFAGRLVAQVWQDGEPEAITFLAYLVVAGVAATALLIAKAAATATTQAWARHLGDAAVALAALVTLGATAAGVIALV